MTQALNPLSNFYRSPKLYTNIPSKGKFYSDDVLDMPDNQELPIYPMTARDESIMKNPDALLNGDAVSQVIMSCVPTVKEPMKMLSNDIDTLLVAIQAATYGDLLEVKADCPQEKCEGKVEGTASAEVILGTMNTLDETYSFETDTGLVVEIRPFTYDSSIKSGIATFQSTRSLQNLTAIEDEMEQLKAFNASFVKISALNFDLMEDSVASISGTDAEGNTFVESDRENIRQYMENCSSTVGHDIEKKIELVNSIGINTKVDMVCPECEHEFTQEVSFDPVNFSTGS